MGTARDPATAARAGRKGARRSPWGRGPHINAPANKARHEQWKESEEQADE